MKSQPIMIDKLATLVRVNVFERGEKVLANYHPVGTVYLSSYWRTIDVTLCHNEDGTVSELTIGNLLSSAPQHTNVQSSGKQKKLN